MREYSRILISTANAHPAGFVLPSNKLQMFAFRYSSASGFIAQLIVRLACGSRSTISTFCPVIAFAAAKLYVVVVFATPPFCIYSEKFLQPCNKTMLK